MNDSPVLDDALVDIKLSERTSVKVKELNGYEFMQAAEAAPGMKSVAFYQSLAAVRVLVRDGQSEPFGNASDVKRLATRLTGNELQTLLIRTNELFGSDEVKEELKNAQETP
jgi:hypothetical protein